MCEDTGFQSHGLDRFQRSQNWLSRYIPYDNRTSASFPATPDDPHTFSSAFPIEHVINTQSSLHELREPTQPLDPIISFVPSFLGTHLLKSGEPFRVTKFIDDATIDTDFTLHTQERLNLELLGNSKPAESLQRITRPLRQIEHAVVPFNFEGPDTAAHLVNVTSPFKKQRFYSLMRGPVH